MNIHILNKEFVIQRLGVEGKNLIVFMAMRKKIVTVVVPLYKEKLDRFESISLEHNLKILHKHPISFIFPKSLNLEFYKAIFRKYPLTLNFQPFKDSYFESIAGYNRLLISPKFYRSFCGFEYILICQTDAFVFRDELEYWCSQNYDYIGAPWFEGYAEATELSSFIGVGNGGFSLRRVDAALKALYRFSLINKPKDIWEFWQSKRKPLRALLALAKNYTITNNSFYLFNDFKGNEDIFWGTYINRNFDWFKVAPFEEALKFSFEVNLRLLFKENKNFLPFGCHAWWKYDLNFWLPHIQNLGYLRDLSTFSI